jgi:hypothetical protein
VGKGGEGSMKRIVLISCVKSKLNVPAKAKDLYISPLFEYFLQYARQLKPDAVYILSAKYGLLELEQIVAPYEMTLNKMGEPEKKAWARRVLESLKQKTDLKSDQFIFLAGVNYRKYLIPEILHYEVPLEGLGLGKQLQELKKRLG